MFKVANYSQDSSSLLQVIEENNKKAIEVRSMIANFKTKSDSSFSNLDDSEKQLSVLEDIDSTDEDDLVFEDEVSFYLDGYRQLEVGFTMDDLLDTLPVSSEYEYRDILMRLSLESVKEIKELTEILLEEKDESQKELIKIYIDNEKRKISMLRDLMNSKDSETTSDHDRVHNHIILAPTSTGNIKILDDLEHIAIDYYPMFRELIDSITNGTFKGIKRFTDNNVLNGICEVRSAQARILFQRIGKNSYALINAFIKKGVRDRGYQEFIKFRVSDYKSISSKLKSLIEESDFILENDSNIEKLNAILSSGEKVPTCKKKV